MLHWTGLFNRARRKEKWQQTSLVPRSLTSKKGGGCSGVHVNLAEVTSRPPESRMTFKGLRPDVEQRNGSL